MLKHLLSTAPKILAECAVAERLRRMPGIELHPTLFNTPLIYGSPEEQAAMSAIYEEYIATAKEANLPLLLTAPTWRLDGDRIAAAEVPESINRDAVGFLSRFRDTASSTAPVLVGALIGPQNDCYRPDLAPDANAAEAFHSAQISELAETSADFLLAQTLPAVSEALGIGRALAKTDKPYLLSFCAQPNGKILDGTPLDEAIAHLDSSLNRPPLGYFVNCTHPKFVTENYSPGTLPRLIGIQANASSKDVTQLDGATQTEADPIASWAQAMRQLHSTHQVPILGGCCGTATEHMEALV